MIEHIKKNKNVFILYIGILITQFANMVEPMLTLLLQNKFEMSAFYISFVITLEILMCLIASIVGGIIADYFNKKLNIVICDSISGVLYLIGAIIPFSYVTVGLIIVAAACQHAEIPSYSALFAELVDEKEQDRSFSMYYLFWMIGMLGASAVTGFFIIEHTSAMFLANGIGVFVSSLLILLIFKYKPTKERLSKEKSKEKKKFEFGFGELRVKPVLFWLLICMIGYEIIHNQYVYLLPMEIDRVYGDSGPSIYGTILSFGSICAILFTTFITNILHRRKHLEKLLFADVCQGSGFLIMFIGLISQWIVLCYFGFLVFTIGEILGNIAYTPYLMINTSEEKRGRLMGIFSMMFKLSAIIFNPILGFIYDRNVYVSWCIVFLVEFIVVMLYLFVLKPKSEEKKRTHR